MKPNKELTDIDIAFPARVAHLMPLWDDIPEEYQTDRAPSCSIIDQWFYEGLPEYKAVPKEEIDTEEAFRHLQCILRSFEPRHEHKTAAVAYLLDQWFESFEPMERA